MSILHLLIKPHVGICKANSNTCVHVYTKYTNMGPCIYVRGTGIKIWWVNLTVLNSLRRGSIGILVFSYMFKEL